MSNDSIDYSDLKVKVICENTTEWEAQMLNAAKSDPEVLVVLGLSYWLSGLFEQAWPILEKMAECKSEEAALAIAWSYLDGYGKEVSLTKAIEWFHKIDRWNGDVAESIYLLDEDFNPIDSQTNQWGDTDLLLSILEKAGPENESKILALIPNWKNLIERKWVVIEENGRDSGISPGFLNHNIAKLRVLQT